LCAQVPLPAAAAPPEPPQDPLGRSRPRGTVLGFLAAARKGDLSTAAQFLNTRSTGAATERLAGQLFTVLDRRLPAKLQSLSDKPDGSQADLRSDLDVVGTISSARGDVYIVVERVARGPAGELWLFSRPTLDRIPALHQETSAFSIEDALPPFLVNTKIAGIALFHWVGVFVCLPAVYLLTGLLGRGLGRLAGVVLRRARKRQDLRDPNVLSAPVRLLIVAVSIKWALSAVSAPLLARQLWSTIASLITITGCVWLVVLFNRHLELFFQRRLWRSGRLGTTSVVRLGRRTLDFLVFFLGFVVVLYHFGLNATAALAGLGVGGISIIFDHVTQVGDRLKVGETLGTIEDIGLRSTRIRTFDRTLISVPNGQIANLTLENLSARDKSTVCLRFDTTAAQLQTILDEVRNLLAQDHRVGAGIHPCAIPPIRRVLETQGELLRIIMKHIQATGAQIALQSPVYVAPAAGSDGRNRSRETELDLHYQENEVSR
jgi:MscS family membrane protein